MRGSSPKEPTAHRPCPGSGLALDILRNEEEYGLEYDHILIDSGTGLTACALLLAFAYLGKKTFLHIVQVAGDKEEFETTLAERKKDFEGLVKELLPSPSRFKLYAPSTAPSFGSVNAEIFDTVAEIARRKGF